MAKLQGTILASKIVPTDSLDTYATHDDKYGRGGHRSVDTLEERDNITTPRRKEGMTVYVKENKTKYILESGIENANWKVDSSGGGSGGDVDLSDYYKKTETYSKVEVDTKIADIPPTDLSGYYNKTETETLLSNKIDKNVGVVGATKTKVTYNSDGIITGGADLVEADLPNLPQSKITNLVSDLSNKQSRLISGTNIKTINGESVLGSGDITIYDVTTVKLTGNQTIDGIKTFSSNPISTATQSTATNALTRKDYVDTKAPVASPTFTGTVTLPATTSIGTVSSTELEYLDGATSNIQTQLNSKLGSTATAVAATKLATARTINGIAFDGSADITISDSTAVKLTGDQTIAGTKTFSSNIVGDITGNAATTTKLKTPVKINGIDFDGSVDITIEAGGSGSSTFTGTAAIDIGGVKVGDSWDNAPISDVVNAIINPELFPTFVNPTFSFTSTVNGFREVGSVTDITFNVNFSRGSITPQYSAENSYRSGLPTTYNYSGPVGSEAKANNTLTDTKTITGYSIAIGSNTFFCSVDYSIGTQPKSSKGNNFNTPLPAGALAAKSVTITGVYPVYSGIGTLSKIPLQAHGTAIVVDAPADMNVGGNRFTIHYPNVWSTKTPVVQQENELSKAWDNQNMLEYNIADINISGVPYKQVKYVGSGIGARKLRLVF